MRVPESTQDYEKFIRRDEMMPHIWCAGCGHGTSMKSILIACDRQDMEKDDVVMISGIGCSGRMPGYCDFNSIHTTHGRALGFGTGIKMVKPDKEVIAVMGDGDGLAIGGNHFIHACRRNIDITAIILNNYIYGMTGGQYSPTTEVEDYAQTAPYQNIDPPFDVCEMAEASGATFVARGITSQPKRLQRYVEKAFENDGFSVVDIFSQCPVYYGRMNKKGDPVELLEAIEERVVPERNWDDLSEDEREEKYPVGILYEGGRREYVDKYEDMIMSKAQNQETG